MLALALLLTEPSVAGADTCYTQATYYGPNYVTQFPLAYACDENGNPIFVVNTTTDIGCIPPLICGATYTPFIVYPPFMYGFPATAYTTARLCLTWNGIATAC
jgi:hypothetical protein